VTLEECIFAIGVMTKLICQMGGLWRGQLLSELEREDCHFFSLAVEVSRSLGLES
jgi:hypothetical protein